MPGLHAPRTFLLLLVALDATGIGLVLPVMPDLLEEVSHQGLAGAALWGGVLASSYAAMQFLFGPVIGNVSDAFGRRPVMLTALAVMAFDYVVMALAPNIWLLLAGRIVAGITAATLATATAAMADISAPEARGRYFGLIGAAFGVGFTLGPLLGSAASTMGLRAPFWAAAALAAGALAFGILAFPETLPAGRRRVFSLARANPLGSFAAIGRLPGLAPLLWVYALFQFAYFVYAAIWSFWGKAQFGWNPALIGISLGAYGICMVLVQGVMVGPMIARFGVWRTAMLGTVAELLTLIFYGLVTSGPLALAFTPLAALAGIGGPALQQILSNAAPADQQGELQGVLSSVAAIATGVAPMVMTGVFAAFTRPDAPVFAPGAPFLLAAGIMLVAVTLLQRLRRRVGPQAGVAAVRP